MDSLLRNVRKGMAYNASFAAFRSPKLFLLPIWEFEAQLKGALSGRELAGPIRGQRHTNFNLFF